MVNVAVAGGTSGIGRAVVEAIKAQGKHQVKILARKAAPETEAQIGVAIIAVDYNDVEAMTKVLDDHQIDTVISAISILTTVEPEVNLVRAAEASKSTKRFISNSWGIEYHEKHAAVFHVAAFKLQAMAELSKTDLEYTRVNCGFFSDYWAVPKVKTYITPFTLVVDMQNDMAAIPGSGDVPVVFTHTTDVAKYVAASLDLKKWEKDTYIIGDRVTWNEFVKLAEAAKGTKFQVVHDSVDLMKTGKVTELPGQVPTYAFFPKEQLQGLCATFGLWFNDGSVDFTPEHSLNDEFPDIKPVTVKELLDEAWRN